MQRENAVMISEEESLKLNNIEQVISYLIESYNKGNNIYYNYNGEMLYSCDGYTFDEYYILAMGMSLKDKISLDNLIFGENRTAIDSTKLMELAMPIYSYLKEAHQPIREELRNGKKNKQFG